MRLQDLLAIDCPSLRPRDSTSMAHSGVVDLYADFMCFGWRNLNVFDGEVLASFPSNGSLRSSVSDCLKAIKALVLTLQVIV